MPRAAHPIDRAPLRVLESANMPAVLLEMGYLTNADQTKMLTGDAFQNVLVLALFDAIVKFRDALTALAARGESRAAFGATPDFHHGLLGTR